MTDATSPSGTKFKVGEKYRMRCGSGPYPCVFVNNISSVFEGEDGYILVRHHDGRYCPSMDAVSPFDVLPEPFREPRKVEGVVYVNEYPQGCTMFGGPEYTGLFGFRVGVHADKGLAHSSAAPEATRVAVKYKVTFVECSETETEEALPLEGPSTKREVVE